MPVEGSTGNVTATVKVCVTEIEWRISKFSDKDGAYYESPLFWLGDHKWSFAIYPNGKGIYNSSGFIQLVFEKRSSDPFPDMLNFSVSLRNVIGQKEYEQKMDSRHFRTAGSCHPFPPSVSRAELFRRRCELLPSDDLTVVCTLNWGSSVTSASCHCTPPHLVSVHAEKMVQDFKELFLKREDSDATINVQGHEFPVHKAILSARSPVLASAFRHDMKEKAANAIDIEDCDPSSFSDFLSFLYYGNVDTITTENVFSLFTTADKYDVQDLRSHCLTFMKDKLSVETFVDTVTVALQHVEKDLIALAIDFFARNQLDVIVTVKWQSFLVADPIQCNDILIKALRKTYY